MKGFIEVHNGVGASFLLNVNHIAQVYHTRDGNAELILSVYETFRGEGSHFIVKPLDYVVHESYGEVSAKIEEASK